MDEVRRAYGEAAQQYIDLFADVRHVHPDDLDLIGRHLGGPGLALDVGCGPGHLTGHLRALGADTVGVDPVAELLHHASSAEPLCRFVLGALPTLPFRDRSVIGTLAWYSLIHLEPARLDDALAELRRVMAPSGVLVIGFFDGDRIDAFAHKVTAARRWPVDELAERLAHAGFTEIERQQRPGVDVAGQRPHAALAARRL